MDDQGIIFQFYVLIKYLVTAAVMVVIVAMIARLTFNYTDPNPFGSIGKFSYWLKKQTDSLVHPWANLLARGGVDARIAPLITILAVCVVGYFGLQLAWNVLFTLDGVIKSLATGRLVSLVGYLLYGVLAVYSLLIVIRIVFSWFLSFDNAVMKFLVRVTEPVLAPFRRFIPPIGFIDISPIIVLFLLNFLQAAVYGVLISAPRSF
jgi:YggT family protein